MHEGCGESCANRWRGMLYGMTNRAGWTGHDPNNNAGVYDPQTPLCKCTTMPESHALHLAGVYDPRIAMLKCRTMLESHALHLPSRRC